MSAPTPVASDIYQVELPLPFLLRSVHAYLVRDGAGWAIIDTGLHTEAGEAAWRDALAAFAILPGDLTQIVVTHHHPDHYGMAGWLSAWNGKPVPTWMLPRELEVAQSLWWQPDGQREAFVTLQTRAGVDAALRERIWAVTADIRAQTAPHPPQITLLMAGQALPIGDRVLRVIEAAGHSMGQALLYDEADALMFCADQVLDPITPNVGLWVGSAPDPLAQFLESLAALRTLPVRLGLPGHRALIADWPGRIDTLLAHHAERLERVRALAQRTTAFEVARSLFAFEAFTPHEQRFAVAEALAHLEHLRLHGTLARDERDSAWVYEERR